MSIFSLDWFKSKNTKKKEEVKNLENEFLKDKPYKKLKMVNDTITVVFTDGSVVTRQDCDMGDFENIKSCKSELEVIRTLMTFPNFTKGENLEDNVSKGYKILEGLGDFEIDHNSIKLKNINRTIPPLLLNKFIEIVTTQKYYTGFGNLQEDLENNIQYNAHKNFFMWCCLNPRAEVADELFRFLIENNFRITKQGFFVALRNVVTLHGSTELVHFISNTYNKVKAVWKKNAKQYSIFLENGEYKLVHDDRLYEKKTSTSTVCTECYGEGYINFENLDDEDVFNEWLDCDKCDGSGEVEEYTCTETVYVNHGELIGNLVDLYLDLPNRAENRFTDDFTRTFDIRIGKIVNMPMKECDWSTQDCAVAGLHFTADQINYVGCGDQSVLMLINPMKVVGIGQHKGRCYEYLPIMTVDREEATKILHDLDFDTIDLDEFYVETQLESLSEKAIEAFAEEAKKYQFNLPAISKSEIENIVLTLDRIKNDIGSRVQKIV